MASDISIIYRSDYCDCRAQLCTYEMYPWKYKIGRRSCVVGDLAVSLFWICSDRRHRLNAQQRWFKTTKNGPKSDIAQWIAAKYRWMAQSFFFGMWCQIDEFMPRYSARVLYYSIVHSARSWKPIPKIIIIIITNVCQQKKKVRLGLCTAGSRNMRLSAFIICYVRCARMNTHRKPLALSCSHPLSTLVELFFFRNCIFFSSHFEWFVLVTSDDVDWILTFTFA